MNTQTWQPMMAVLGLSGVEAVLIMFALVFAVAVGAGLLMAFAFWLDKLYKKHYPPTPATQPTPPVIRTKKFCQKCGNEMSPDAPQGLCPACLMQIAIGTEGGGDAPKIEPKIAPPAPAELTARFPQLEIIELLGHGGMGAVYKARQKQLDRLVALKVLPAQSASDAGFAERFNREARALAKLSHPNIVGVYDYGQTEGLPFFIMEYVDGLNLRQLERAGKLPPREALQIIPQICEALQFAHDEGVVHRDIKPENVLLDKKGRVKIADFGLAKILALEPQHFRLTGAQDVMGTPHYMAPEQVERPREVDHRADIYSLGVVFYEMLTGELPLGRFAAPSQKVQVDVRLDEVVLKTLEKEPARRYQQVSEVKTQIETIAGKPEPGGRPTSQPIAPRYNPREKALAVRAAAFFAVMLLVCLGIALQFPRQAAAPLIMMGMCVIGLGVCGLRLVGLWPFSSSHFPDPSFSSRNLVGKAVPSPHGSASAQFNWARQIWRALKVGLGVWICVAVLMAVATLLLPKSYMGSTRISLGTPLAGKPPADGSAYYLDPYRLQTEFEIIQSEAVLDQVIQHLDLPARWGRRYSNGKLSVADTRLILKQRMEPRPIRNTTIVEILCYSEVPEEAAELSTAIASSYVDFKSQQIDAFREQHQGDADSSAAKEMEAAARMEILEHAQTPRHPARPNVPLNIALGVAGGFGLGLIVSGIVLILRFLRHSAQNSTPLPQPATVRRSWKVLVIMLLPLIAFAVALAVRSVSLKGPPGFGPLVERTPPPVPETHRELSFGPVHEVTLGDSDNAAFVDLDTDRILPAYKGMATDFDAWKRVNGVDLWAANPAIGEAGVGGFYLMASQISSDRWLTITPEEAIKMGNKADEPGWTTNSFLKAGGAYLFATSRIGMGVLQVASLPGQPRAITVRYKMIQAPVAFGPTLERVINLTGSVHGALNLTSGNYLDRDADGADLAAGPAGAIKALNMRWWDDSSHEEKAVPPGVPSPWDSVDDYPALLWWVEQNALSEIDTNKPENLVMAALVATDKARRLHGCVDVIGGTNTCAFTTRDGTEGVLQIVGDTDNPRGVKIRYRLVESASMEDLRLKLQAAEEDLNRKTTLRGSGAIPQSDYENAKTIRDILAAQINGDAVEVARLELERAERAFNRTKDAFNARLIGQEEFNQANQAFALAQIAYRSALQKKQAGK